MIVTVNTFTETLISLVKAAAEPLTDLLVTSFPILKPLKGLFVSGAEAIVDLVVDTFSGTTLTDSNMEVQSTNDSINTPLLYKRELSENIGESIAALVMPSADSDSFIRAEMQFPATVLTYEKSTQNPDGNLRTLDGFSTKQFYYNMNDEKDDNGELVLN